MTDTQETHFQIDLKTQGGLALIPAATLGAYWVAGETGLWTATLGIPALMLSAAWISHLRQRPVGVNPRFAGLGGKDDLLNSLTEALRQYANGSQNAAVFVVELDDLDAFEARFGTQVTEEVLVRTAERLQIALRETDVVCRISPTAFAITTQSIRRFELENAIQIAGRLQANVQQPVSMEKTTVFVTCSVGFCMTNRAPGRKPEAMLDAAIAARHEAFRNGPGSIRAYSKDLQTTVETRDELADEVEAALKSGDITAWFQPQVCNETGTVSGFEALARWRHPKRGLIPPFEFLGAAKQAGQGAALTKVMIEDSFRAMQKWEAAGFRVPNVGVNFSTGDLEDPKMVENIRWQLDRFDMEPERLSVEILESVIATTENDTVHRNIEGLSKLGCQIDLDDFGTGHASISSLKQFSISRIKVDRSFVIKVDQDPDQQKMMSTILMMAEQLGLETLAEGVETPGEHAILAQLGCGHVQGYGLGRPMPFDETIHWLEAHKNTPITAQSGAANTG